MKTILDSTLPHEFWSDLEEAKCRALSEAANTAGIILEVKSIEIKPEEIVLIGELPAPTPSVCNETINEGRPKAKYRGIGTFHTTWAALTRSQPTLGFLVLLQPVNVSLGLWGREYEGTRIAVELNRCCESLPVGVIGVPCCALCNEPISEGRLKAIPGVRTCIKCQHTKEELRHD